ncbi:MAG: hypothetical protein ACXVLQ_14460 [Bacteriovorax sp.]
MTATLKRKMENFFDSISERELSKNRKLLGQIEFLKKYLGTLGDGHPEIKSNPDFQLQKYFRIQFKNVEAQ